MSQKTFKYPLQITGTKTELEALLAPLEELGYNVSIINDSLLPNLVTNAYGTNNRVRFFNALSPSSSALRTKVSASNPALVLALAAALEGTETHKGEAYFCYASNAISFTKGKLYFATQSDLTKDGSFRDNNNNRNGWSPNNHEYFRKATKEEIIEHFTPQGTLLSDLRDLHATSFPRFNPLTNQEMLSALGVSGVIIGDNIVSEEPIETTIPVRIQFIKDLHASYFDDDNLWKKEIEKEFPTLFKPAPTFAVGETIKYLPRLEDYTIVGYQDPTDQTDTQITLLSKCGYLIGEPVQVDDADNITEEELIEAGENIGLTSCNYAKFCAE